MTQAEISLQHRPEKSSAGFKAAGAPLHKPDAEKCSCVEGKEASKGQRYGRIINCGESDHTQQSADPRTAEQTLSAAGEQRIT